ncbi:DUF6875 domain-containing protein [Micromonospora sagamiensis]|uniref:DUF6875 domain-containing protein n=1 Tax=Micromonospora sagamiensis TaxID=47875 RepID=A0A562WKB5_9ACTN|nr:hypothetical protein [Micromonospora sagamiensis]TWJ30481.1 hypothetical protein JD81_04021 [Micromonospora sagamiensis]BCL16488.1 hypothetical protein GCM10017556_42270 [Micromonospora sagamiensis]
MPGTDPLPRLRSATEVRADPAAGTLRTVLEWCVRYLVAPHPELGRTGSVCPYTAPALRRDLLYLAELPGVTDVPGISAAVGALRDRYQRTVATLPDDEAELLTYLLVLPDVDRTDPGPLDALQARVKDEFVTEGLMVGQFHPYCPNPGLWNEDFRPLRSPVPLLAVRRMLVFDLPFLTDSAGHFDAWVSRFAGHLPARVRSHLSHRVVSG